ncbi:MAG: cadherin repeat domain-containing protein, partial [Gammaproteobacteria bacterium]|nr:cadherin repeat domain-containing protein [Gammaproteobacteria bacterium]
MDPENANITYSISEGPDSALFSIDSATGQLAFSNAPDFEDPRDVDANNVYELEVSASDSVIDIRKNITVTVTNSNEGLMFTGPADFNLEENIQNVAV